MSQKGYRVPYARYAKSFFDGARLASRYAPIARAIYNKYSSAPPAVVTRSYKKSGRMLYTPRRRMSYTPRRRMSYTPRRRKPIRSEINKIKRQLKNNTSTYIKKQRDFISPTSNVAETAYTQLSVSTISNLESVIDAVKYFDPSTPGTLINVDLSSVTHQAEIQFTKVYSRCIARNNYVVPVYVTLYYVCVKKDTSISPTTSISNSLTDMSNTTIVNPLIYPSDCHDFKDLWEIRASKRALLGPGEMCSLSYSLKKPFQYDISFSDSHSTSYQKAYDSCSLLVRVEGVPSHGSTSGVTQSKTQIDCMVDRHYTVQYPGGSDIIYIEAQNNADTTVGTVQFTQLNTEQETFSR